MEHNFLNISCKADQRIMLRSIVWALVPNLRKDHSPCDLGSRISASVQRVCVERQSICSIWLETVTYEM